MVPPSATPTSRWIADGRSKGARRNRRTVGAEEAVDVLVEVRRGVTRVVGGAPLQPWRLTIAVTIMTAPAPPPPRPPPRGNSALTAATAVTLAATAWPEGKDPPLVCTSEPAGRTRSYDDLSVPMEISDRTMAEMNAAKCHHRRRRARNPAMANRTGSVTYTSP